MRRRTESNPTIPAHEMAKGLIERQGLDHAKRMVAQMSKPEFVNSAGGTKNPNMGYWIAVGNYIKHYTKPT